MREHEEPVGTSEPQHFNAIWTHGRRMNEGRLYREEWMEADGEVTQKEMEWISLRAC